MKVENYSNFYILQMLWFPFLTATICLTDIVQTIYSILSTLEDFLIEIIGHKGLWKCFINSKSPTDIIWLLYYGFKKLPKELLKMNFTSVASLRESILFKQMTFSWIFKLYSYCIVSIFPLCMEQMQKITHLYLQQRV